MCNIDNKLFNSSKLGYCNNLRDDVQLQIDTNKGLIDTNKGLIDTNKGLIDTNKGLIDTNKGLIDTNKGLIDTNKGLIDTNKSDIASNLGLINTNKSDITSNVTSINTNKGDIEYNLGEITKNRKNIFNCSEEINDSLGRIIALEDIDSGKRIVDLETITKEISVSGNFTTISNILESYKIYTDRITFPITGEYQNQPFTDALKRDYDDYIVNFKNKPPCTYLFDFGWTQGGSSGRHDLNFTKNISISNTIQNPGTVKLYSGKMYLLNTTLEAYNLEEFAYLYLTVNVKNNNTVVSTSKIVRVDYRGSVNMGIYNISIPSLYLKTTQNFSGVISLDLLISYRLNSVGAGVDFLCNGSLSQI
jgi:hypothetical protein